MEKDKIEYKLLSSVIIVLRQQKLQDGKLFNDESVEKIMGTVAIDVKPGLSLRLFDQSGQKSFNATNPVLSTYVEGNKILMETKGSGVSGPIIFSVLVMEKIG